jgi:hypothetical protein
MQENRVVIGVFLDQGQAKQALQALQRAGFREDQIGFLIRDGDTTHEGIPTEQLEDVSDTGTTTGTIAGGVVGGVAGAAAASLIPGIGPAIAGGIVLSLGGAVLGAATGRFIALLIHLGFSEEQARSYDQEVQAGRSIVIVQADERPLEAFEILKRNRAYDPGSPSESVLASGPEATIKLEPDEKTPL